MWTLPSVASGDKRVDDRGRTVAQFMCRATDRPLELIVRDDRPAMPLVIDRRPQVRATLKQLAAEYRPQLHELRRRTNAASAGEERRQLKRQRRGVMKRYRAAKRAARATLYGPFAW